MWGTLFTTIPLTLFASGRFAAAWPIKTINLAQNCDPNTQQYLQVEAYDFHENPKVTMTWRQVTGECGSAVSVPVEWTATYDVEAGDDPPEDDQRVQLNLFVCCPFGEYELELEVDSSSPEGSSFPQRTSWEIENGPDEYHIWDTVNTILKDDEAYSPTVPGIYKWPLPDAMGFYSVLYAGPLPPIECESSVPAGTVYKGCYVDSASSRTFSQDFMELPGPENPTGMTPQVCSNFCADYDFFGVEYGEECFCGTSSEFSAATSSSSCGLTYQSLCTGDSTVACGGVNSMSIYERTSAPPPVPPPTPAPGPVSSSYMYEGCFDDSKSNRIMAKEATDTSMTAEMCFNLCNDGTNTHFGTQYSIECWCGVDPDLTKNGEEAGDAECNMDCAGTSTGEKCGGFDRMSAYKIDASASSGYVGCYADMKRNRAMPAAGLYFSSSMTNEMCQERCSGLGYNFAGTQYGEECWCDNSYDTHGEADNCDYSCSGDSSQICGGYAALSVYEA